MGAIQLHLLVEASMEPIPDTVKVIQEFDENLEIVGPTGTPLARGRHCALEGTEDDLCAWLGPFERVYLGKGAPAFQDFEVVHIKREL